MTMTDTGVKPIPAYVPPEDGKPRNAVDEKWMKLTRSARHYMERRAKARKETIDGSGVYPAGARKLLRQHTRVLLTFRV